MKMSDDILETDGKLVTIVTCPFCDDEQELEGDMTDTTIECPDCGSTFTVRMK